MCTTCGTSLLEVNASQPVKRGRVTLPPYDFRHGETDLMESTATSGARAGAFILVISAVFVVGILTGLIVASARTPDTEELVIAATETPRPTLPYATVTLGPPTSTATNTPPPTPTPTDTGTPAPCIQRIVAGGSLIGAITNCGYTSLDIMPTVMALNNITDPAALQLGQEIVIPWPTPTFDPNAPTASAQNPAQPSVAMVSASDNLLQVDSSIQAFAPTPTPTLPPGVMWHNVQAGDNIITIAVQYNANAKTLSELNPEVDFARCEFGERFGGPQCLVQLRAGQLLRVPAPTPTPTLSPTPDPNATATPTATPTYNEPNIVSPANRAFFSARELITLRWIPSATLRANEAYRIDVTDLTTNTVYTAFTTDISFLVPLEWQGRDAQRHEYSWTVGIVSQDDLNTITFQTQPRLFVWQGLTEKKP